MNQDDMRSLFGADAPAPRKSAIEEAFKVITERDERALAEAADKRLMKQVRNIKLMEKQQ